MRAHHRFARNSISLVVVIMLLAACGSPGTTPSQSAAAQGSGDASGSISATVAQAGDFMTWGPLYVAVGEGIFEEHGLDIEVVKTQGGPDAMAALVSGSAQFSTSTMGELFAAYNQGQPVRLLSPLTTQSQITCAVGSEIADTLPGPEAAWDERIRALQGRTIGVTSVGGGVSKTLSYMLIAAGMDPETDVVMTAIGADPVAWVAAMSNNQIEAMCAGVPITEEVVVQGAAEMYVSPALGDVPDLEGMLDGMIATSQQVVEENPELLERMVAALNDAMTFIQENPEEAAATIKEQGFPALQQSSFDQAYENLYDAFSTSSHVDPAGFDRAFQFAEFSLATELDVTLDDIYLAEFSE